MNTNRYFAIVGCLSGWTGVILQYIAISRELQVTLPQYLTYFTILTNTLLAIYFTVLVFPGSSASQKINTPSVATALTVYILIVGLVYQTSLRQLYNPQGLFLVSDNIVHALMPSLMLVHWASSVYGQLFAWKLITHWIVYPLGYLFFSLIRGAMIHWYPYPFLDVDTLGYPIVWMNSGCITIVFIGLSALLISLSNRKYHRSNPSIG